jgi:23S rRNA (cytosine1962-C5)-methyltransferase
MGTTKVETGSGRLDALIALIQRPSRTNGRVEAQRLFHGRGHAWPGFEHLVIDLLPPVAMIGLFRAEDEDFVIGLATWLQENIDGCETVVAQRRFVSTGPVDVLLGTLPDMPYPVVEDGFRFLVQPGRNRNTGLFLDMRNGREWVRRHSRGKRLLNLFAYTCGFSVAAIAGGATAVMNIYTSSPALASGRENHRVNDLPLETVRFEKLDIFKSFGRIKRRGPYDLLICDPPTLQKGSVDIERDYPRILRRLADFMAPDSELLLCLNAPHLGRDFLLDAVARHAPQYRFCNDIPPPDVFAEAQHRGLKTMHWRTRCKN